MSAFRRRLRLSASAWLVFQVLSLSAIVPRECCDAHRPASAKKDVSCHESPAAISCPMPGADGSACPMHGAPADHQSHHGGAASDCSLRGSCKGPMAALFTLLSQSGILLDSVPPFPVFDAATVIVPAREHVLCRLESPDPPPPRA